MNTKTAGVIVLIAFLTALVIVVWILVTTSSGKMQVVRIDSDPRHTHVASEAYTARDLKAKTSTETVDADE